MEKKNSFRSKISLKKYLQYEYTDKDGHICCRSLVITEAKFGKPEAEAYTTHTFLRHGFRLDRAGGGGGIPCLRVRDPLASARGLKLAQNGKAMLFISRPREILPLLPAWWRYSYPWLCGFRRSSVCNYYFECIARFRLSAFRSCIDRFLIFSSAASVIMPPRRDYGKNVSARNTNTAPPVPDQKDSNAEFQNAIQLLTHSVTNQNNQQVPVPENASSGSVAFRVRDFVRMNQTKF
ncbi:hypothetical protein MTR67_026487 [Solanum verrucosum]|uniref:Uncharacterized protein n=1 Tax=Solanum verrucosum TaxID=315347 RepID=A0AAF0QZ12_SOLVR|nr:hypothetical protein MTR67_026487 [Solanum verrucosum]